MPRSIQEILDQADELAKRFEDYEPSADDERQVADAVIAARGAGASWQKIGNLLGTSAQAALQRYGALVEAG